MSSIGGCGPTQHQVLIQQGMQHAQAAHMQQQRALEQQTISGLPSSSSPGPPSIEANKGLNIDVYV